MTSKPIAQMSHFRQSCGHPQWTAALFVICAALGATGCATTQSRTNDAFRQCLDQQAVAPSPACWKLFLQNHAATASEGQLRLAREYEGGGASGTAGVRLRPDASSDTLKFPPRKADHALCYKEFSASGNPQHDLQWLASRCGEPAGMLPYSDPVEANQAAHEGPQAFALTLRADRCYRIFAAGGAGVSDLDAVIIDGEGNILVYDVFVDPAPILGPHAPFCPPSTGEYKVVFATEKGGGAYAFQVWHTDLRAMDEVKAAANRFNDVCRTNDSAQYGVAQVGMPVVIGRHREVNGDPNWTDSMNAYVGKASRIVALSGTDGAGCPGVRLEVDNAEYFWRIRDLRPAVNIDPNALNPYPPGGVPTVPRGCGFEGGIELYGPIGLGSSVQLARHTPVADDANWTESMEKYVGAVTKVTRLRGVDGKGCPVVGVEVDGDEHAWRVRDLIPMSSLAGDEQSGTRGPMPGAGPQTLEDLLKAIENVPEPTSSTWDSKVGGLLVGAFDADLTGRIDTVAELHAVPCVVWQTINTAMQRDRQRTLRVTYGFDAGLMYVGEALKVAEDLRSTAALRLAACGL